jgi:hypothetical protein
MPGASLPSTNDILSLRPSDNLHPVILFLELIVSGFILKTFSALGGENSLFRLLIFSNFPGLGALSDKSNNVALPLVQFVCLPRH